jgi:hypothetical protein
MQSHLKAIDPLLMSYRSYPVVLLATQSQKAPATRLVVKGQPAVLLDMLA